jgi:hypothetical protein
MPLFRCGTPSVLLGAIDLDCLDLACHQPDSPLSRPTPSPAPIFYPSLTRLFPISVFNERSRGGCSSVLRWRLLIARQACPVRRSLVSSSPASVLGTAALEPSRRALRSVLLSSLPRPCLKKPIRQRRSPRQSTSPRLGAGPLAFGCPKTLGTTNPSCVGVAGRRLKMQGQLTQARDAAGQLQAKADEYVPLVSPCEKLKAQWEGKRAEAVALEGTVKRISELREKQERSAGRLDELDTAISREKASEQGLKTAFDEIDEQMKALQDGDPAINSLEQITAYAENYNGSLRELQDLQLRIKQVEGAQDQWTGQASRIQAPDQSPRRIGAAMCPPSSAPDTARQCSTARRAASQGRSKSVDLASPPSGNSGRRSSAKLRGGASNQKPSGNISEGNPGRTRRSFRSFDRMGCPISSEASACLNCRSRCWALRPNTSRNSLLFRSLAPIRRRRSNVSRER